MKQLSSNIVIVLLMAIASGMAGCINDDELDFPDDRSEEITSTLELYTLLNYFQQTTNNTQCFSIVFPIELGYNTGVVITVADRSGLIEALENQSSSFYVEGVVLPVLVNNKGVLSNIESEEDISSLLSLCDIPELASILDDFESQCFEFVFPLTLVVDNDTLHFDNEDQYDIYEDLKGDDFLPALIFPVSIERYDTDETITISNYYELLQLSNDCEECPEGSITIDPEFDGTYTFKAIYDDADLPISNKWYINDDLIGESKDLINIELGNGEYEVCLKSFHEDCTEGSEVCRSFTVDRPCPTLFFNKEKSTENPRVYFFYADFALQNEISYGWVVYQNDDFLYFEEEFPDQSDGKLTFEFTPGSYTVCLEKENVNEDCQLAQYCEEIIIE